MDNESILEVDKFGFGTKFWKNKEGELHRLDGPAVEYDDGSKQWWQNGKRHRLDGPAIEYLNGHKVWYQNGMLHRSNGPAAEYGDTTEYWYNGVLHRIDGPAIISQDGSKAWFKNGRRFKNKDTFFRSLNKKEKELALFSEDFLNG